MKLAVISDIHEDIVSLRLAIQKIEKANVDEIICLGDISGYNPKYYNYFDTRDAHECLDVIKQNCIIILLGNHDLHAIKKLPELSPEFDYPKNWYSLDYYEKMEYAKGRILLYDDSDLAPRYSKADLEFLSDLKQYEILNTDNYNILFSHYAYPNISGLEIVYYLDHTDFSSHFKFMDKLNCKVSITGHEHTPGLCYVTKTQFRLKNFGKRKIKDSEFLLMCPSIANGRNRNGFMIYDTTEKLVHIKRL
jgi:predicted phosphodiesterase